jgi:hypothetical protein
VVELLGGGDLPLELPLEPPLDPPPLGIDYNSLVGLFKNYINFSYDLAFI